MDQLIMKWERIPQIYPLFLVVVVTFVAYVMSLDTLFIVMLALTAFQFLYFCFNASYKYAKKMEKDEEPEDDVTGNTNISKKFIDHM